MYSLAIRVAYLTLNFLKILTTKKLDKSKLQSSIQTLRCKIRSVATTCLRMLQNKKKFIKTIAYDVSDL